MGRMSELADALTALDDRIAQRGYWLGLEDSRDVSLNDAIELFKIRWGEEPDSLLIELWEGKQ